MYTYEYDGEGNRTKRTSIATDEAVEYAWDHRNRLTQVTFKDDLGATTKTVEYTYDVLNRRIAKLVDGQAEERYLFDGQNILLVFDGASDIKARYLQGPGMDNTLAEEDGDGDFSWLLPGHQGSVRDVVDNDGAVVNHLTYDSFGNILTQTSTANEPRYTYTGREWDGDAQLFHYRARWYDAGAGRFISEDPIGFEGGDSSLVRYTRNDPGNHTDPLGLLPPGASLPTPGDGAGGGGTTTARPAMLPATQPVNREAEAPTSRTMLTMSVQQMKDYYVHSYLIEIASANAQYAPTLDKQLVALGLDPLRTSSAKVTLKGKSYTYYSDGRKSVIGLSLIMSTYDGFWSKMFHCATLRPYAVIYFNNWKAVSEYNTLSYESVVDSAAVAAFVIASSAPGFTQGLSGAITKATLPHVLPTLGSATGRTTAANLNEQLAMEQAKSNPTGGIQLKNVPMTDSRWPASDGWVKMSQNINGTEIHYVRNSVTGAVDDFKFK